MLYSGTTTIEVIVEIESENENIALEKLEQLEFEVKLSNRDEFKTSIKDVTFSVDENVLGWEVEKID